MRNVKSKQATLSHRVRRRQRIMHRLLTRDTTSIKILLLSALVGSLVGGLAVGFAKTVDFITFQREQFISLQSDHFFSWIAFAFGISFLMGGVGYFLVKNYAPEASGSGIPEIEGALEELRPVRWWRVLPVKFFGGLMTLGSGLVLGREGPTIQMGGNLGQLVFDLFRVKDKETRHSLLAVGAAAGLTAAFNAPLAGILFIIEEMRAQFRYNLISIKAVFIGVICATIMYRVFNSDQPILDLGKLGQAGVGSLWLFLLLGLLMGGIGYLFNKLIFMTQDAFRALFGQRLMLSVIIGAVIAGLCGVTMLFFPAVVGGGHMLIPQAALGVFSLQSLLFIFMIRIFTTIICFSSGAPGGIFAPMLALGTLFGSAFGMVAHQFFPLYNLPISIFAIAGMGALLAASVRAPLTGIVLVLEMTDNYQIILAMIITCLGATLIAQLLGGKPLYSAILARTLANADASVEKERRESVS